MLAQRERLPHHEIEEIHALAHGEQALRPQQTHPRSQTAVEFHDHRLPEQIRAVACGQFVRLRQITGGGDALLGDQPRLIAQQRLVVPFENSHRRIAHAGRPHLYLECIEIAHAQMIDIRRAQVNAEI